MIWGNGAQHYRLEVGQYGYFNLNRESQRLTCPYNDKWLCGDQCALFHRNYDLGVTTVHLCCTTPETVIRIREEA